MKHKLVFLLILNASLMLTGCASDSANMRIGTSQSNVSLSDQRQASQVISVSDQVPIGAVVIGDVDASRCHRYAYDKPPTGENVISDLKMAAFARGADGLANIRIDKKSALLKDCWHTLVGKATIYTIPKTAQK